MIEHSMENLENWMGEALIEARRAALKEEVPVGAIVVHENKIIARAHNNKEQSHSPTGHAEIKAIENAAEVLGQWRLSDCTLITTLEPCLMCVGTIVSARVGHIVYGASDPKGGAIESQFQILQKPKVNHIPMITQGVMAKESSNLLKRFFETRRNKDIEVKNGPSVVALL